LVRAATERGIQVSPIPGASALLAAVVASGLDVDLFTFLGFLAG
jgi:16S rRNA (cytidine1402-2'-O)-methyltransferase